MTRQLKRLKMDSNDDDDIIEIDAFPDSPENVERNERRKSKINAMATLFPSDEEDDWFLDETADKIAFQNLKKIDKETAQPSSWLTKETPVHKKTPTLIQSSKRKVLKGTTAKSSCKQTTITSFFGKPQSSDVVCNAVRPRTKLITSFFGKQPSTGVNDSKFEQLEVKIVEEVVKNNGESAVNKSWEKKSCPFYKIIPNTGIAVDAFSYGDITGVMHYFLSHFHSDHYQGLTRKFSRKLYCSKVTANLVQLKFKLNDQFIKRLPVNESTLVGDVLVTPMEANHCPGSVMFLFQLTDGSTILHTGDFRGDQVLISNPALRGLSIDTVYLDTTYCDPRYDFPSQLESISFCVQTAQDFLAKYPRGLIVIGTYTIGKEKVFLSIAEALNLKVWVDMDKLAILEALEDDALDKVLTMDKSEAQIHVVGMHCIGVQKLRKLLAAQCGAFDNRVLAIRPTGWSHSKQNRSLRDRKPDSDFDGITIYGVPYSEHSSFSELRDFIQHIKPTKIIPTVNVASEVNRSKMDSYFSEWLRK